MRYFLILIPILFSSFSHAYPCRPEEEGQIIIFNEGKVTKSQICKNGKYVKYRRPPCEETKAFIVERTDEDHRPCVMFRFCEYGKYRNCAIVRSEEGKRSCDLVLSTYEHQIPLCR